MYSTQLYRLDTCCSYLNLVYTPSRKVRTPSIPATPLTSSPSADAGAAHHPHTGVEGHPA